MNAGCAAGAAPSVPLPPAALAGLRAAGPSRPVAVSIRTLRPQDAPLFDALVRGLSPAARQARFHAGVRELSPRQLERLTRLDARHEHALIATCIEGRREVAIGEARYALPADDDLDAGDETTREFAIVVADAAQGAGVGTALLCRLLAQAGHAGVRRLYGDLIRDNRPMLALASRLGFSVRSHPGDPRLQRVELELVPAAPLAHAGAGMSFGFEAHARQLQMKSAARAAREMFGLGRVLISKGQDA